MLIRSILRWKTALALKLSCNFSRAKIERINTVARHVLLQNHSISFYLFIYSFVYLFVYLFINSFIYFQILTNLTSRSCPSTGVFEPVRTTIITSVRAGTSVCVTLSVVLAVAGIDTTQAKLTIVVCVWGERKHREHVKMGQNRTIIGRILTHRGRDKMDAIFHAISSDAFSWMKMCEFPLRFHWTLFLRD